MTKLLRKITANTNYLVTNWQANLLCQLTITSFCIGFYYKSNIYENQPKWDAIGWENHYWILDHDDDNARFGHVPGIFHNSNSAKIKQERLFYIERLDWLDVTLHDCLFHCLLDCLVAWLLAFFLACLIICVIVWLLAWLLACFIALLIAWLFAW